MVSDGILYVHPTILYRRTIIRVCRLAFTGRRSISPLEVSTTGNDVSNRFCFCVLISLSEQSEIFFYLFR